MKIRELFYKFFKYLIAVLFFLIIAYLVYLAGFSTAVINSSEHTYLIGDSMLKNLFALFSFILILFLVKWKSKKVRRFIEKIDDDPDFSQNFRNKCLMIIGIISFLFILIVKIQPTDDQLYINNAANGLLNKDYTAFKTGGYVERYPNQLGIILLLYLFAHIFGSYNYFAFQICNVIALIMIYKGFADISDFTGHKSSESLLIIISGIFFLPGILYTSFVYGNLIGLAFSVNGFKYLMYYDEKRGIKNLFLFSLFMYLAVLIKNNYLIFLIGEIVYLIIRIIKKNNLYNFFPLVFMVVILLFANRSVNILFETTTGIEIGKGTNSWSWIAMGLQPNSMMYDGWYNEYNYKTYTLSGFNGISQEFKAKRYILNRIAWFKENPSSALKFFAGKNASQWNNPDYQSIWINRGRVYEGIYPYFLYYLLSIPGSAKVDSILNYFQFILFFGAILYVLFYKKKTDEIIFYEVTLIGGFIFHTFWEAKCQYVLPYVMLLIPLSVHGYMGIIRIESFRHPKRKTQIYKYIVFAGLFIGISCLIYFSNNDALNNIFLRNEDTYKYIRYISENTYLRIGTGNYLIIGNDQGKSFYLSEGEIENNNINGKSIIISDDNSQKVYIGQSELNDEIYIRFDDGKCLDVPDGIPKNGKSIHSYIQSSANAQKWTLHSSKQKGKVNIVFDKRWALTYNTRTREVYLKALNDMPNQQWNLISADNES